MNKVELRVDAYRQAQRAVADLKAAVLALLAAAEPGGMSNSQVGRLLGIYQGHVGHEGHISRTVLQMLQADGVIEQEGPRGVWRLKADPNVQNDPPD